MIERKGLDQVLCDLRNGDTLVVWKLDRLGRSTLHLMQLLDGLRSRGIDFVSLTQGIDTTTAVGRMLYGQLAVFAEFEREQIRERTKAGMKAAQARGVHVGRPKKLSSRQVIRAARELNQSKSTITELAAGLNVSAATMRRALSLHSQGPAMEFDACSTGTAPIASKADIGQRID